MTRRGGTEKPRQKSGKKDRQLPLARLDVSPRRERERERKARRPSSSFLSPSLLLLLPLSPPVKTFRPGRRPRRRPGAARRPRHHLGPRDGGGGRGARHPGEKQIFFFFTTSTSTPLGASFLLICLSLPLFLSLDQPPTKKSNDRSSSTTRTTTWSRSATAA